MKTLLEKAKESPAFRKDKINLTPEMCELAVAWMKGDIVLKQANIALGKYQSGNTLYMFSMCFRELYRQGKLIIK